MHLQQEELSANTGLVHVLRDGRRRVYKKHLIEKYGFDKKTVVDQSLKHPQVLDHYRTVKGQTAPPPLDHDDIASASGAPLPRFDELLQAVLDVPVGREHADAYERTIEALLTALFYPSLVYPIRQHVIHGGLKRIDILYTNMGNGNFFWWVAVSRSNGLARARIGSLAGTNRVDRASQPRRPCDHPSRPRSTRGEGDRAPIGARASGATLS